MAAVKFLNLAGVFEETSLVRRFEGGLRIVHWIADTL